MLYNIIFLSSARLIEEARCVSIHLLTVFIKEIHAKERAGKKAM